MLTGLKGVKYGLQPGAKQKAKPVLQKQANVFGDDDDEEGNVGQDIARHAAKKQSDKKVNPFTTALLILRSNTMQPARGSAGMHRSLGQVSLLRR